MMLNDVRLRAVLLTLLLVVMLASVVQFWPESNMTASESVDTATSQAEKPGSDPLRRHFDWAVTQLKAGHFQQAINGFRAVLEQSPAMPEAYINTGFAQIELQQYEQALASFQTALDLRPEQVNAYWGLAVSLEGLCDIPGAMGAMRTYLHLAAADDPYRIKASAALWEWEQLKTSSTNDEQAMHDCGQALNQPVNQADN